MILLANLIYGNLWNLSFCNSCPCHALCPSINKIYSFTYLYIINLTLLKHCISTVYLSNLQFSSRRHTKGVFFLRIQARRPIRQWSKCSFNVAPQSIVALNVSLKIALNVSLKVALNVSLKVALNVSLKVALNVSLKVALNVSLKVALNISLKVTLNVSLKVALNVSLKVALNVSLKVVLNGHRGPHRQRQAVGHDINTNVNVAILATANKKILSIKNLN